MVGALDPELRATVVLRDSQPGTTATVSLYRGTRKLGQRQLAAASCDEALDAVVAVTALALSSTAKSRSPQGGREHEPAERQRPEPRTPQVPPSERQLERATAAAAREPAALVDGGASREAEEGAAHGSLSLSTGVELLGSSGAMLISLGAALRSGGGAWRARLWYGLPAAAEEEEAVPLRSLQTHSERGAVSFDYCRDVDVAGWLALCAGLELGVVRHRRAETLDGEARPERRWLETDLAAALGSRLTYRQARWQPGIELSTSLPVLPPADGRRVGLRAQAGVAVPF
jgi:hypothetical protein